MVFDPIQEKGEFIASGSILSKNSKQFYRVKSNRVKHGEYRFGYARVGYIGLRTAAYHNGEIWARLGKSRLVTLNHNEFNENSQVFDNNILDGQPVLRFVSTPYGLIAIGSNSVGLIEVDNGKVDGILSGTDGVVGK